MAERPVCRPLLLTSIALAACASSEPTVTEVRKDHDPAIARDEHNKLDADARRRDFTNVMLQLDKALDSYVRAISNTGVARYDEERERLDRLLRQLVRGTPSSDNTKKLIAVAGDSSDSFFQGIALAALGFADNSPEVMPVILQGAQLSDPLLVDRAVLGLAILKDASTPPGVVSAVMLDPKHPTEGRVNAAWALVTLQETSVHADQILPVWKHLLEDGKEDHPLLIANAVRGLGLSRDAQYGALVARYLTHPTPRVRFNAAVALGRMNAQDQWEKLLALLSPAETGPNVRLAARKALQALAGNVDRGYDIELWRREFQRGQ